MGGVGLAPGLSVTSKPCEVVRVAPNHTYQEGPHSLSPGLRPPPRGTDLRARHPQASQPWHLGQEAGRSQAAMRTGTGGFTGRKLTVQLQTRAAGPLPAPVPPGPRGRPASSRAGATAGRPHPLSSRRRQEEAVPMGSQPPPPLAALCLLGVLVAAGHGHGHGASAWEGPGLQVKLNGSSSQCQGRMEVFLDGVWHTVDSRSWGRSPGRQGDASVASLLCRSLSCRDALLLGPVPYFSSPQNHITCHGRPLSFSHCNTSEARQGEPLSLICLEPLKRAPPSTRPPPTTTPEPTAPPRLRLVPGPGGLRCAGVVEFYSGRLGGAVGHEDEDSTEALGDRICEALQCGSFLKRLPEAEAAGTPAPGARRPLPIRWEVQNASCASLEQCFRRAQPREAGRALALVCSDFQPQVQSRLVGGSGVCEGSVEVRQGRGRQWEALCHSHSAKDAARWAEVCQEQQCGPVSSYRVLEAGEKATRGLVCPGEKLSQCHRPQERRAHCKRVFVTCQDPNRAGLGTGTVMSIVLALVLLAVLLVMCGPLAYKKLVKKFRQKKQRQWIGPTGMNQSMSFHRDPGTTVRRSQVENPAASHLENEYSQPPRSSQLSAYPALEGALCRVSAQPDNSSDSDYDLHGAQRL